MKIKVYTKFKLMFSNLDVWLMNFYDIVGKYLFLSEKSVVLNWGELVKKLS